METVQTTPATMARTQSRKYGGASRSGVNLARTGAFGSLSPAQCSHVDLQKATAGLMLHAAEPSSVSRSSKHFSSSQRVRFGFEKRLEDWKKAGKKTTLHIYRWLALAFARQSAPKGNVPFFTGSSRNRVGRLMG